MIELVNVTKRYKTNNALNDITLKINQGDIALFVGENGSGKSTCLKLINRVIFLNSFDRGQITNTFKSTSYLPEKLSFPSLIHSEEYLKIFKKMYCLNIDIKKKMDEYKVPNKFISSMSKGMKQKLGIIITLMTPAELYIFDEPTDGLDAESKKLFISDIKMLLENGKTILICTHNKNYFKDIKTKTFTFKGGNLCKMTRTLKKET